MRLRNRPSELVDGRQPQSAGGGVAAAEHQRGGAVEQYRRTGGLVSQDEREHTEEAVVGEDRVEPGLRHEVGKRLGLVRHRGDEQPDDVEVEPLDAAGFLASAVGFQQGQVEVALGRQRRRCGARRPDVVGATGAGQHGDAIPAVHQSSRDVEQRADVPDG